MSNSSAAELHDDFDDRSGADHDDHDAFYDQEADGPAHEPLGRAPEQVEVRRNGGLAAGVGAVASAVAIAYLARAIGGGSWLDWALVLVMGGIATAYLMAFVDARTPLLVADAQGVRIRLGRTWRGVPWRSIECVEHEPRRGLLRDGRLVLVADDPDTLLADLDASGRRQVAVARRLHGSPFAIPLALSTRVNGAHGDLTAALERLADDPDRVVELVPEDELDAEWDVEVVDEEVPDDEVLHDDLEPGDVEPEHHHPALVDPRPTLARGITYLADRLRLRHEESDDLDEQDDLLVDDLPGPAVAPVTIVASSTPVPMRDLVSGARAEVRFDGAAALAADPADAESTTSRQLPEAGELRRPEPLVIDDLLNEQVEMEPAEDPVIGPELAAARTRLNLSVDQLADRTRIRPHVIESIEVDDFAPCGGDFYARGHLRTLARVLGVDAAPLLEQYDERYSDAPINARRVFEAELATGRDGPIRSTRGGPNWSVLVAAVMALVLAWSIARLVMDSPVELHHKPVLNGSPSSQTKLGPAVPVVLDAAKGGAHVVVRDGGGQIVFNGDLPYGATKTVKAAPPVRVQSSDGALKVKVDGQDRGPLGADGQPAQNTFAAAS